MALQLAPASHTQITEVIIYNQSAQKIYWHLSALYSGRFHFLSGSVTGLVLLDFDPIIGGIYSKRLMDFLKAHFKMDTLATALHARNMFEYVRSSAWHQIQ